MRRGGRYIISTTSGPPQGGMLGNALDKGAGYKRGGGICTDVLTEGDEVVIPTMVHNYRPDTQTASVSVQTTGLESTTADA